MKKIMITGCLLTCYFLNSFVFATVALSKPFAAPTSVSDLIKLSSSHGLQTRTGSGVLSFTVPNSAGRCIGLNFQFWNYQLSPTPSSTACAPSQNVWQKSLRPSCITEDEKGQTYYIWPSDFYNLFTAAVHSEDQNNIACLYVSDPNNNANNTSYSLDSCSGGSCHFNGGTSVGFGPNADALLSVDPNIKSCHRDADCVPSTTYDHSFEFLTLTLRGSNPLPLYSSVGVVSANGAVVNPNQALSTAGFNGPLNGADTSKVYQVWSSQDPDREYDPSSFVFYESTDPTGLNFIPMDSESGVVFPDVSSTPNPNNGRPNDSANYTLGALYDITNLGFEILSMNPASLALIGSGVGSPLTYTIKLDGNNACSFTPASVGSQASCTSSVSSFDSSETYSLTVNSTSPGNLPATWILSASMDGVNYFPIATQLTNVVASSWVADGGDGGSTATNLQYLVNFPPAVTSISPNGGSDTGGNEININGNFLSTVTGVTIGGSAATILTKNLNSLLVQVPSGTANSPADVVVTNPAGSTTVSGGYTYDPAVPSFDTFSQTEGSDAGGDIVTISNTTNGLGYLNSVTSVTFDGNAAKILSESFSSIQVQVPPETTSTIPPYQVAVVMTNPSGSTTVTDAYTYEPPSVTSVSCTTSGLNPGGGDDVTISGNYLNNVTQVIFGETIQTVSSASSTSVDVTNPGGASGSSVEISLEDPYTTIDSGDSCTYSGNTGPTGPTWDAPSITSVEPSTGSTNGGDTVVISGDFHNPTCANYSVYFGSVAQTVLSCNSEDTIQVTSVSDLTDAGVALDVKVSDFDWNLYNEGGDAYLDAAFTYITPTTVTEITPDSGSVCGGTLVSIDGSGLGVVNSVSFGGTYGNIYFQSDSLIEVYTPQAPGDDQAGLVDVVLTIPDGEVTENYLYTGTSTGCEA